ncbi:conserved hypothetical protein (partial) [Bordetella avium 197N]|uniref:Uncharacterized protein n=1 Tax=Bordetella avium (strain 197N) TaxID=360910 RepID=Q2KY25_BORA1|nr:conserved hypothetical protein (partial) [Bordetella avium 197N]
MPPRSPHQARGQGASQSPLDARGLGGNRRIMRRLLEHELGQGALMFQCFPLSVGVARPPPHRSTYKPAPVSAARGGEGFAEIAKRLRAARRNH